MESLYAEFLLWSLNVHTGERYRASLNSLFLRCESQSEILLELEECSSDIRKTASCFRRYWEFHEFNTDAFEEKDVVDWGTICHAKDFDAVGFAVRLAQALNDPPFDAFRLIAFKWIICILGILFRSNEDSLHDCLKLCSHFHRSLPRELKSAEPFDTFGKMEEELSLWSRDTEAERRDYFKKAVLGNPE